MNKISKKDFLLHNIAAKYIVGEDVDIELKGSYAELSCLKELLDISKKLMTLLKEDSSLDDIIKTIENKKTITNKFQNLTGIVWRL